MRLEISLFLIFLDSTSLMVKLVPFQYTIWAKKISALGYDVFANSVSTDAYTGKEFIDAIERLALCGLKDESTKIAQNGSITVKKVLTIRKHSVIM